MNSENKAYLDDVLDDMNNCVSPCVDIPQTCPPKGQVVNIDWLVDNLPGMNYVKHRALNYIFSNGLTAGGEDDDEKLDEWLYESRNEMGSSNYLALREAIGYVIVYGECGLRMYKGNLYPYQKGHFGILYEKKDGINSIVAYYVREDGDVVSEDIDKKDWDQWERLEDIESWFSEKKLLLLSTSEFTNLRNDTSKMHGLSPLLQDKQRIKLLLSVYERLNYDIEYDGPGRIILRAKSTSDEEEETSTTSEILNNSGPARADKLNAAKLEAKRIAREMKQSSSDQVFVLSDGFKDDIEHLPRVTRATEFMSWLENEGVVVAQILGMSSVLVEVGKWSGNVSMEKVIDDAMINTIVPLRELYAVQFSYLITKELGVGKVYFDKYDMKQAEDENVARQKIAGVIRDLALSAKNLQAATEGEGAHDYTEAQNNISSLLNEVSEVLRKSLYDENGVIRTLAAETEPKHTLGRKKLKHKNREEKHNGRIKGNHRKDRKH